VIYFSILRDTVRRVICLQINTKNGITGKIMGIGLFKTNKEVRHLVCESNQIFKTKWRKYLGSPQCLEQIW